MLCVSESGGSVGVRCCVFQKAEAQLAYDAVCFRKQRLSWRTMLCVSESEGSVGVRCCVFPKAEAQLAYDAVCFRKRRFS